MIADELNFRIRINRRMLNPAFNEIFISELAMHVPESELIIHLNIIQIVYKDLC